MLRLTTLFLLALTAQQPPPNTALVVGRVVDQTDGKPISGAVVEVVSEVVSGGALGASGPPRRQMTDGLGRFVFRELAAGIYTVRASVGGRGFGPSGFIVSGSGNPIGAYLPGGYGQRRPGGPLEPVRIAEGQIIPDAIVRLWRGGALSGTIVDHLGDPVVLANVAAVLVSSDGRLIDGPSTTTDDLGRYRLSSLAPGRYIVFVSQTIAAMPADLAEAAVKKMLEDNAGRPPSAAMVGLPEATGIRVGSSIVSSSKQAVIVGNAGGSESVFVFPTTFYPQATTLASARAVEIGAGEDRSGVDISLRPVRAAAVSGTVFDQGAPAGGVRLRMVQAGSSPEAALFEVATTLTDAQGKFTFPVVPVGDYTIATLIPAPLPPQPAAAAPAARAGGVGTWLWAPVGVPAEGVGGLSFSLKSSFNVTAQVEFSGSSPRPTEQEMARVMIALRSVQPRARFDVSSGGAQAALTAAGGLTLNGLIPGRYAFKLAGMPPAFPWRLQSVLVGGRELNELPVDLSEDLTDVRIVLTDRPARVSGRVAFADPAGGAADVVIFPVDQQTWSDARGLSRRFRLVRTSAAGEFAASDVPPGEYFVVAIADELSTGFPDVGFLNSLVTVADRMRVDPNGQPVVALTVKTPVKRQ